MPLSEGAAFAGYTVVRLLGTGEMAEVYLVRHPRLPRLEALKVLRADLSGDRNFQQRFISEADRASGLWHPHIVGVHDRGEFNGQLWIAMDYVDGPNLREVLSRHPSGLTPAEVLAVEYRRTHSATCGAGSGRMSSETTLVSRIIIGRSPLHGPVLCEPEDPGLPRPMRRTGPAVP